MSLRLILMRHAKSSWKEPYSSDHGRSLNKRGKRDARKVARYLHSKGWAPDLVLSSDSVRTKQTWSLMQNEFDPTPAVEFHRELYHAGFREFKNALSVLKWQPETVLVLGHNPGWEESAEILSGYSIVMKTSTAILFDLECDTWTAAMRQLGKWLVAEVVYARDLVTQDND